MKIGILGAGNVGGNLGTVWAAKGHDIVFGVRDPHSPKAQAALKKAGPHVRFGTLADAAQLGEVVVVATPWPATEGVLCACGPLTGKIVIDVTNPVHADLSGLMVGHTTSAAEQIAKWTSGARVVKAFNTVGAGNLLDVHFDGHVATMPICGDDPTAKEIVGQLVRDVGFEVIDAGPLRVARWLEPLAMLWIHLAVKEGLGPHIGLKLLRREQKKPPMS